MGNCCGEQTVPPTEKAATYVVAIKVIMFVQFLVVIMNFVAADEFLRLAIIGLIFLFVLFVAYYKLSYQAMMVYIFMCLFFSIMFLIHILTPVQKQQDLSKKDSMTMYIYVDACISFIFYVFCSIFCFFPYRQFKAIEFSENPAIAAFMEGGQRGTEENLEENQYKVNYGRNEEEEENRKKKKSYDVFKGQGIRIG